MKAFYIFLLLFVFSFSTIIPIDTLIDPSKFKIASLVDQIILVIPPSNTSTDAMLFFYVKKNSKWEEHMETEAYIGEKGLGKTIKGDKKTPVGVYKFNRYFGINDNPGISLPYVKINESYYWDGDSKSKNYNTLVNNETYQDFNISDSKHLIEMDPGYEYALNIDYNEEQTPDKGSGIFLHCFTGKSYTDGGIAIDKYDLHSILREINEDCHIIIDTEQNMEKYTNNVRKSSSNFISNKIFLLIFFIFFLYI